MLPVATESDGPSDAAAAEAQHDDTDGAAEERHGEEVRATGTWKAYRVLPDGTLEIVRARGILRHHIEGTLEEALAA